MRRTSLVLTVLLLGVTALSADDTTVTITSGRISGSTSPEGDVRIYKGIPFAAPPVGRLRWKAPQPVKPWTGVRQCTTFGPWCPQPEPLLGHVTGRMSEDCLYLNVWTPAPTTDDKLPVMVWIHGGGHTTGSGASPLYDGTQLARKGVVLVTINYRLGPFGYMAHPLLSAEAKQKTSGNYGLLDQIAALTWVQRNIQAFGGDPDCVTIFGESAGGASVTRLLVSPPAKGLFHRAISQSGAAHGRNRHLKRTWSGMPSAEEVGKQLSHKLGCDEANDELAALRDKSWQEILAASNPAQGLFGKGVRFGPIVDGWAIPDDPTVMLEAGRQHDVPVMVGSNADEATIFMKQLPIRRALGYRLLVRRLFTTDADRLLRMFPAETDEDVADAINGLFTVSAFVNPARFVARATEKKKAHAWLYHFTRVPDFAGKRNLGAFHGLEIAYVFGKALNGRTFDETDRKLSEHMMSYWTNFARTGDPNGPGLPHWPVYAARTDPYIELGDTVTAKSALLKDACDLIETVYKRRRQSD